MPTSLKLTTIFSFLFLLVSTSTAYAYTSFANDTFATNTTSSYDLYGFSSSQGFYTPKINYYTGIVKLEAVYADSTISLIKNITIPANMETIAIIDSTANTSINSYVVAYLKDNETFPLVTSSNNTLIIPAVNYERQLRIEKIGLAALPFYMNITKFKVYSLDAVEGRDLLSLYVNETVEIARYCGAGASLKGFSVTPSFSGCDFNYYVGVPGAGIPSYDYDHIHYYNATTTRGLFVATDSENQTCEAMFINGVVVARRVSEIFNDKDMTMLKTRDPYYTMLDWNEMVEDFGAYQNCHYYYNAHFVLSKLTLTAAQVTTFRDGLGHYVRYNGVPIATANMTFINYTNTRADISLLPYLSTASPAGTQWQYSHDNTNWLTAQDFFNADMNFGVSCTPTSICNPLTGNTTFYGTNCQALESTYCGACGCNAGLTNCNVPTSYGVYCDGNEASHRGYFVVYGDCTPSTYALCTSNTTCSNYTSVLNGSAKNTISCIGVNGTASYCVDNDGTVKACSSILTTATPPTITGNFFSYTAGLFGSFFGLSTNPSGNVNEADLENANSFLSLIISLVLALVGAYLTRKEENMTGKVFLAIMCVSLIGFTIIGMFPALFLILIIAFVVFMASGALSALLGGHKK